MRIKIHKCGFNIILIAYLSGCATVDPNAILGTIPEGHKTHHSSLGVVNVTGEEVGNRYSLTNNQMHIGLTNSIVKSKIFDSVSKSWMEDYLLSAEIIHQQWTDGFNHDLDFSFNNHAFENYTYVLIINYKLVRNKDRKVVYEREFSSKCVKTPSDASPYTRGQYAIECGASENISQFLADIATTDLAL